MIRACLALILLFSTVSPSLGQESRPIRMPRHPSLSPDGEKLAFGWQGDIWIVSSSGGTAQRLTIHEAHEMLPAWSPDGKRIAFSSKREGGYDVWVIPAQGGRPTQLTFHSADDLVSGWSPDSRQVLFSSNREATRYASIYAVDATTGATRLMAGDETTLGSASFTPDGRAIACRRGGSPTRRGYRGSGNSNLILFPVAGGPGTWLAREPENENWPLFAPDGKSFYFVSDRGGAANLWRRAGSRLEQLTRFTDGSLYYPALSANGERLAFERSFAIWSMATQSGVPRELKIYAPTDDRTNPVRRETFTGRVQEAAISPDGKQAAFIVHGELFLQKVGESADSVRLTDTVQREEDIAWSPDGRYIIFSSDRSGGQNLYRIDVKTKQTKQLTTSQDTESGPQPSPDGKWIAYVGGFNRSRLLVMPADGGPSRVLVTDPSIGPLAWSPDSKWLAYSRIKAHSAGSMADVFVVSLETGRATNVTRYPVSNVAPVWSADGKSLYFTSDRTGERNLWRIPLVDEPEKAPEETEDRPATKADPKTPIAVRIDFDDIHKRAVQITRGDTGIFSYAVSPDSKTIVFAAVSGGRPDLWRIPAAGGTPARLTQSGESAAGLHFSADGGRVFYLSGGALRFLALNSQTPTPIPVSARMEIDSRALSLQMFDEAWRKMRDGFYDEKMHGVDWNRVRETYRPVVEDITYKEDFYALFTLALGELNASHTGISGPTGGTAGLTTSSLGITLEDAHAGPGARVKSVLRKGPADNEASRLLPGDVILRVNGQEVPVNELLYLRLGDQAGKWTEVTFRRGAEEKTVKIKPISLAEHQRLAYEEWQRDREQMVEKLSDGRLGYLHLDAMGPSQLEKFRRAAYGDLRAKDGLVLDVRFNGGGSIADEIFAILQAQVFSYRTLRGDTARLSAPLLAFDRPVIVLANELSFSNAEVFPWGMKQLKLGKVVGVPTHGSVIGTGGTSLIDGSSLRMPAVGSYTLGGVNMENNGCPPDIYVENTPEEIYRKQDRQLARAVEELLKELPKAP